MTAEEYDLAKDKLYKDYEKAKKDLAIKYGLEQAIFGIGDIIRELETTIQITRIRVYIGLHGRPQPIYEGVRLIANLTPTKRNTVSSIYGNEGVQLIKKADVEPKKTDKQP